MISDRSRKLFWDFTQKICITFRLLINAGFNEEATFILNKKNNMNLVHNDYEYRKHRLTRQGQTYWYCGKKVQFKCKAKAYTIQLGLKHRVRVTGTHNHLPEEGP